MSEMINMECLANQNIVENYTVFSVFLTLAWPFILIICMVAALAVLKKCKKLNDSHSLKDYVILVSVMILYISYPNICDRVKSLIICSEIEEGEIWLVQDY